MNMQYFCPITISWQQIGDVVYIFDEESRGIHILEKTAVDFWNLLNQNKTIEEMLEDLVGKYNVSKTILEKDVLEFIETLIQKNILQKREREYENK